MTKVSPQTSGQVLHLEGPAKLDHDTGLELFHGLRGRGVKAGESVVLDLSATEVMDSLGGAWLLKMADFIQERKGGFRWEGQRDDVQDFMDLLEPGLLEAHKPYRHEEGIFEEIGGRCFKYYDELREFFNLSLETIFWTFLAPFTGRGMRWGLVMDELYEMGVRAVRINCMMNFLLGLIIAMLSSAQIEQFGIGILVADLIVIGFARELASIMTAIVVSARSGAAIAAELATKQVQEEIDALHGMGLSVCQFLIAPKLLAMLIVMPCLVALGLICGILGGSVWGVIVLGYSPEQWFNETLLAASLNDVFQGLLKSMFFALMIVMVGCHNGLRVRGGSRGVGLMTTRAVVMDIFFIIVIDIIFAAIFYYVDF